MPNTRVEHNESRDPYLVLDLNGVSQEILAWIRSTRRACGNSDHATRPSIACRGSFLGGAWCGPEELPTYYKAPPPPVTCKETLSRTRTIRAVPAVLTLRNPRPS